MQEVFPNSSYIADSTNNFSHPVKVIHLVGSLCRETTSHVSSYDRRLKARKQDASLGVFCGYVSGGAWV